MSIRYIEATPPVASYLDALGRRADRAFAAWQRDEAVAAKANGEMTIREMIAYVEQQLRDVRTRQREQRRAGGLELAKLQRDLEILQNFRELGFERFATAVECADDRLIEIEIPF